MKTIHFLSHDWWTPHFETDLELLENHLSSGHDVLVVECGGKLPCCMRNAGHRFVECLYCQNRTANGLKKLRRDPRHIKLMEGKFETENWAEKVEFSGKISEFCELKYKDFDIGYAVATYWVDRSRNPDFNFLGDPGEIRRWLDMSAKCYDWFCDLFEKEKPDRVYAMNGRHLQYRAFLNAARKHQINCKMHERGGDKDRYMLFDNDLPHNRAFWNRILLDYSRQFPDPALEGIGCDFFEKKRKGVELNYKSFVDSQIRNLVPENLHQVKGKKIAVFLSSEFEFAAVSPEWLEKPYADQNAGIVQITREMLAIDPEAHFFIRVHPNMSGHRNENLDFLLNSRFPNATVISPESKISSYSLMDSCDLVLTFGSTMGIEACYWGKPSILAGKSYYQVLGAAYQGLTHQEVLGFLIRPCEVKPRSLAVIYGAAMSTFGEKFKYVEMETPFKGTFKGQDVNQIKPLYKRVALKVLSLVT
jgi:hypothetical protein